MLESSYNLLFGKLALRCLFEDYFEEANRFTGKFLLKPTDDPHVDLVASVSNFEISFVLFSFYIVMIREFSLNGCIRDM
jgi:hypothetical protein